MAPPTARRAPLVLLPLLLAALTACAGTAPSAAAPAPSTATPSSRTPAVEEVTELSLVVAGSEVTGDTPLAQVRVGEKVRLSVTSDVADELHVHGVDETLELTPGQTEVLELPMRSPGRFEVELHDGRRVLTRLQVR